MARLWSCGFELQSATSGVEWDTSTGGVSIDTTTKRSGAASFRCNPTAATKYITHQFTIDGKKNLYFRFYLRIATSTNALDTIFVVKDGWWDPSNMIGIRLNSDRTLELWDEYWPVQIGSDSSALDTDTWYRIEVSYTHATTSVIAYIDGVSFATGALSVGMMATTEGVFLMLGAFTATTADLYFDDIAINDDIGTSQIGLPGEGSIVHMHPDSAGDASATTGTYADVDEVAPDDATSYIEQDSIAEVDYNFETSASAGIGASDTIALVSIGTRQHPETAAAAGWRGLIMSQSGGTTTYGDAKTHNDTTWKTNGDALPMVYSLTSYTDPQGGGAWTTALLDTMQAGIDVTDATPNLFISTIWALVEYVPQVGSESISPSTSPSVSSSLSESVSQSLSPSISPSGSVSQSLSPSISPSGSVSQSISPSISPSGSVSQSLSPSKSPSASSSLSESVSSSISPSLAPSFPTVEATNYSHEATAVTSHDVSLPSGIQAGDLLLVVFGSYVVTAITTPSGWSKIGDTDAYSTYIQMAQFYKIADGEEGATVAITTAGSTKSSAVAYRITGFDSATAPEKGTAATSVNTTPNPPSVSPTWGSDDNLFIAVETNRINSAVTAYPTNYSDNQVNAVNSSSTTSSSTGICSREYAASSDDPGTFTIAASRYAVANTIVIKPSSGVGSESISPSVSPSISPSFSESISPSLSRSVSPSLSRSVSSSVSQSISPSISPSGSVSQSLSPSKSLSISRSASPSVSESASLSRSPSLSKSASVSASPSLSKSASPSVSESSSVSISPSISPSGSISQSISPSLSESASPSASPSVSESASLSVSPSISPSGSISQSISPSLSESVSPSASPSLSESASESVSPSVSPSEVSSFSSSRSSSLSPSLSPSTSSSRSPSISPSVSPSISPSPSHPNFDLTEACVAQWHLNEESWNGTPGEVIDSIGTNHGTAVGGATTAIGKLNRCGSFDGADDYVSIPDNIADLSGDWAIDLWLNPVNDANPRVLTLITTDDNLQVGYNQTTLKPYIRVDGVVQSGGTGLSASTWQHIVYQVNSGTKEIYVNNVKQTLANGGPSADGQYSAVGGGYANYNTNGLVDEVRVFNRALTETEIGALYNNGDGNEYLLRPSNSISISASPSISSSISPSLSESASLSVSPSISESISPSISPSVSESISQSISQSISPSISESVSPSASPSASPSLSESASESISPSVSRSVSQSVSLSASPSISPSGSVSQSISPSISPSVSESVSESASPSVSSSVSVSISPSVSPSASLSISPSISSSISPSGSVSQSVSLSVSPSTSPSRSLSLSPSVSVSISPSLSESASPSLSKSVSKSASPSVSKSISPSASPSLSLSTSPSLSSSASQSVSPSISPSASPSLSLSASPSLSSSASQSVSPSISPSVSPSVSPSPPAPIKPRAYIKDIKPHSNIRNIKVIANAQSIKYHSNIRSIKIKSRVDSIQPRIRIYG